MDGHDLGQAAQAERAAARIGELLADLTLPPAVMAALRQRWPPVLGETTPVAVRSSATAEDLAEASFAGQYRSLLGVPGLAQDEMALQKAITICWLSFFSPNALAARATQAALGENEGMAVLIQPMIAAECSGVCTSLDPVRQRRDVIVVVAAWGLGAGDGAVATDTAWLRRSDLNLEERRVVDKPTQIGLSPAGDTQIMPVSDEQRRAACLPEAWLWRIAQFGLAAEQHFGQPQELEWAIAGQELWLLQSRPLTGLPPELAQSRPFPVAWAGEAESRSLWRLESLADDDREIPLPLEVDYFVQVEGAREETCRFMGADRNQVTKICNGRVYTRPVPLAITAGDFRIRRAALADLKERLARQGITPWDYWGPEIVTATERLRAFDPTSAAGPALAEHLEDALAVSRRHYMLHSILSGFGPHRSFLKAFAAVSGLAESEAEEAGYVLLLGEETPLTRLVDGLYELACLARQEAAVAALIANPPADAFDRLARLPGAAAFQNRLDEFLASYSERVGNGYGSEATICSPTWREKPIQLLNLIAPYLDPKLEAPAQARQKAEQARQERVEALYRNCDDPEAVAEFRRELVYARKAYTILETHNHYLDQMNIGQLRQAQLAAANWLVGSGLLAARDDIFWLRFEEILEALRRPGSGVLGELIAARRAQYAEWSQLEAPSILGIPAANLPERPPLRDEVTPLEPARAGQLSGLGASPGRYRGRARVAPMSMSLPDLSPGEVLVAENVGPRWTPLFPILGGLILDGGSVGQHAAATAREYGLPAVIQTGQATRRIPDGAWVTLDGTAGTVVIESLDL